MHSVNSTTAHLKRFSGLVIAVLFSTFANAQENSPYSRYGLGDMSPSRNVVSRGMGGIAAGLSDFQSINFMNPAAVASLATTVFDVGGGIDLRTLKSNTSPEKFRSVNTTINYVQLGFPIVNRKNTQWGVSFGIRPITRINYKIETNARTPIDSMNQVFEGNGGLTQANITTGVKIKNLSLGISSGYSFGNRDFSHKIIFINDTVPYKKSNSEIQSHFGGIFLNIGAQYEIFLNKAAVEAKTDKNPKYLRLGAYANLQHKLDAKRDDLSQTFEYSTDGSVFNIDTVSFRKGAPGKINMPASYSFGFTYADNHWTVGADLDIANWDSYTNFGAKDPNVQNSFTVRAGAQYFPASVTTPAAKYWNFVKYRAGVYYGNDYVITTKTRPEFGASFGAGFPLTSLMQRNPYAGFATLNLGLDIGVRGDKNSQSIRENVTRFSIGFSMNSRWFQKLKYN